jgi:Flp pilus assembly protein TadD
MGNAEISQSISRLDGRFGNAAYFGGYLLFNIFLTAYLMAKRKGRDFLWYLYLLAILLESYILFRTETRGSMLGLFIGIIITSLLFIFLDKKRPVLKWAAVGMIAILVSSVVLVFKYEDSAFVRNNSSLSRIATINFSESTVGSRFMVWGMAIEGFKERPILGWGQDNYNYVFNKYYDPGMYNQEQWFDRAHDIFLDWLIAAGLLGLICYLLLFFSGIALAWQPETKAPEDGFFAKLSYTWKRHISGEEQDKILERSILTGLFASYFVHNVFVFDNLWSYILFFSLLGYLHHEHVRTSIMLSTPKLPAKKFVKNEPSEEPLPFSYIGTTVIFVFAIVFYFVNWKPIQANTAIISGISPHAQNGQPTIDNLNAFKEAIGYGTFGSSEAREQLIQTAMRIKGSSVPEDLQQSIFTYAREQSLLQLEEAPNDARYETFTGMLFLRYGMNPEALAHFGKAHDLSPKKQTIAFNLIMAELNAGEKDKALALAKEAYDYKPEFNEAALTYAVTLIRTGDPKSAEKILVDRFGSDIVYNENLVNAYAMNSQYDKVISILKKQLEQGEDPQLRLRLAAAYLESGDKENAILEIQKIQAINPQFKEQGDYYIKEIKAGRKP